MSEFIPIEKICIRRPGQPPAALAEVNQALRMLTQDWDAPRGPRHRDAVETLLKIIDGHRSSSEARRVLLEAAAEAGYTAS